MRIVISGSEERKSSLISTYHVYRIDVFENQSFTESVARRYSEFAALRDILVIKYQHKGKIIPALPGKTYLGMVSMTEDLVSTRRRQLQLFLQRCMADEVLSNDSNLIQFCSDEHYKATDSAKLVKSGTEEDFSGAASPSLLARLSSSWRSTEVLAPTDEDRLFDSFTEYIRSLDPLLRTLMDAGNELVGSMRGTAACSSSYRAAFNSLGVTEDGALGCALQASASAASASQECAAVTARAAEMWLVHDMEYLLLDVESASLALQARKQLRIQQQRLKLAHEDETAHAQTSDPTKREASQHIANDLADKLNACTEALDDMGRTLLEDLTRWRSRFVHDLLGLVARVGTVAARSEAAGHALWNAVGPALSDAEAFEQHHSLPTAAVPGAAEA